MLTVISVLAGLLVRQPGNTRNADVTLMNSHLGGVCTADFTVKDATGKPVYGADVHVRVRYGFWSVKRADLEVGTSSAGKARLEGLPDKARPLAYDIKKGAQRADVVQNVESDCHAAFDVTLK